MSEAESQFRLTGGLGPLYLPRFLDNGREVALGLGGALGVPALTRWTFVVSRHHNILLHNINL